MEFLALADQCASFVAPHTLEAIVKTESNFDPLKIGVNGGAKLQRQPVNVEEAIVTAQWLLQNGYNIDLGLGQVNSSNFNRVGLSVTEAFDPCKNLKAAGTIFNNSFSGCHSTVPGRPSITGGVIRLQHRKLFAGIQKRLCRQGTQEHAGQGIHCRKCPGNSSANTLGQCLTQAHDSRSH